MTPKTIPIYQFKISLNEIRPAIWRRFVVSANITLYELHHIIQIIMGWQNYHLHDFQIDGQIYGDPADDEFGDLGTLNESDYRLRKLLKREGQQFGYEYDFGDSWQHTLTLEKILPPDAYKRLPLCLGGNRACPPEDVGGVNGFEEFLAAIRNPRHEEHDSYLKWAGDRFDPRHFDPETANQRLRQAERDAANAWDKNTLSESETPAPTQSNQWADLLDKTFLSESENLPLRQDALALLTYLQMNRVTGTQSTGNFPLKAVREISALFVHPPALEDKIGEKVYPVHSEVEVRALYFIHHVTLAASLIDGGPGRRWKITTEGEQFLIAAPAAQLWQLFLNWWQRGNWGIAYAYVRDDFPPPHLRKLTAEHLLQLTLGRPLPFELFADQLIQSSGLRWGHGDNEHERSILHGLIKTTAIQPLSKFGVLELEEKVHPILGGDYRELDSLTLTALGKSLLKAMETF